MIKFEIPDSVSYILRKLNQAGYEAFIVGGCVRDALLGRRPNDWDITTSALPVQVKQVFKRTIDTGIQHGTVTVLLRDGQYEVTTYRVDGIYEDSRHPKQVSFTSNLKEDLRRRDFTINAMAYHPETGIVDPYNGIGDLEAEVIRAVGNPNERFDEDALRIMRAVRFSAQLGFGIDPETYLALKSFAVRLELISNERIRDELIKLLVSKNPDTLEVLADTGILEVILPGFRPYLEAALRRLAVAADDEVEAEIFALIRNEKCVAGDDKCMAGDCDGETRIDAESNKHAVRTGCDNHVVAGDCDSEARFSGDCRLASPVQRLAAMLFDQDSSFAASWLRKLRLDNDTISKVSTIIKYRTFPFTYDEEGVRRCLNAVGDEFDNLIMAMLIDAKAREKFRGADHASSNSTDASQEKSSGAPSIYKIINIFNMKQKICARGDCVDLKHLAVRGADLIAAGVKPGPQLGKILNALLELVLTNPALNNREQLLELASKL